MRASLVAFFLLLLALPALAGVGGPEITVGCDPCADITVSPAGGEGPLEEQGCVVHVRILDLNGQPIVNYPASDIWLDDIGNGEIALCPGGSTADGPTDANGETTISGPMYAGGGTEQGLLVYIGGVAAPSAPLPIRVNSPDLTGDLLVDLRDVGEFALDYANPGYQFRSDLNRDGVENLGDIGAFAIHFGEACP